MNIKLKTGQTLSITGKFLWNGFYNGTIAEGTQILDIKALIDGERVAGAEAGYLCHDYGGGATMLNIYVEDNFRRMGIAKAIYDFAEKEMGEMLRPYPGNEGGAIRHFWHDRLKEKPDLLDIYKNDIGPLPAQDKPRQVKP